MILLPIFLAIHPRFFIHFIVFLSCFCEMREGKNVFLLLNE